MSLKARSRLPMERQNWDVSLPLKFMKDIILRGVCTLPQNIQLGYSKNPHHPPPWWIGTFLDPLRPTLLETLDPSPTWISRFFQVFRLKLNLYSKEYMYHTITPRRCYCVIYKVLCGTQLNKPENKNKRKSFSTSSSWSLKKLFWPSCLDFHSL